MLRLALVLAGLIVAVPSPGRCDWQYARWGMTVDQVKAASAGEASDNPTPDDQATQTEDSLLIARTNEGGFEFKAFFMFDRRTRKLGAVTLKLLDQTRSQALYAYLVERYGRPVSQLTTRATRVARWIDQGQRNNIAWSTIGGFGNSTVRYSELRDPGRNL